MESTTDQSLLAGGDPSTGPQHIPVNAYETTDALVVVAPMPGVMPDDVEVTATGNELRLRARVRTAAPKDYLLHEWDYGGYDRVLELPDGFDGPITASFGNGQLAVSVAREGSRGDDAVVVSPD